MLIKNPEFKISAVNPKQYPDDGLPQIVLVGKSNVGKSSFINRIAKKASAGVGNTPGFTKQKQWIRINAQIELLDTPGVLWPKFESEEVALNLAYTGTIKDDVLQTIEVGFSLLKKLIIDYPDNLVERYKLEKQDIEDVLKMYKINQTIITINQIAKI